MKKRLSESFLKNLFQKDLEKNKKISKRGSVSMEENEEEGRIVKILGIPFAWPYEENYKHASGKNKE